ncbi:hypothetical protein [Williamsia sp.]|uniref:hypothetical protein n=1 Tax=Williamsia sp. TaxID=1872085 RepID=UPI001A2DB54A|nr:hypothetical protein [Williamsia sp.]MBJ7289801.1 hypothetical protein [Williamsia sp.]
MIDELQDEAAALLAAGEWTHALAEFSVLREIRSRRDGPYSLMYLSNLHDSVRCMCQLELWSDSEPLCRELYGKYRRTHGPGEADTVDAAKRYAWALVQLNKTDPAVALYLATADALWTAGDRAGSLALLGAAVVHRQNDESGAVTTLTFDGLCNGPDLQTAAVLLAAGLPAPDGSLTMDGLRLIR